jgi:N-acetylneuraminate synthase
MKRAYIIAEAGVNHNGSLEMAKKLIDAAAAAGADSVKFQTFIAKNLVTMDAPKAEYQQLVTEEMETQYDMLRKLELSEADHRELIKHCELRQIAFLSTPFDLESLNLLTSKLKLSLVKLPSGEITNAPLLLETAKSGVAVILSTGMCTLGDIELALGILAFGYLHQQDNEKPSIQAFHSAYASQSGQNVLKDKVSLLHCTTEYPSPFADVNLLAMETMKHAFLLPTGLSDHTQGIAVPIAAVARGAMLIEKHFTLDRSLPGPDHLASIVPDELELMVSSIRQVEEAMGTAAKLPTPSEVGNRAIVRKSIVAARDIRMGEILTKENLTAKRPGDGVSPVYIWDYIGKTAPKDFKIDEKVFL